MIGNDASTPAAALPRVLVVDDDPAVGMVIQRLLRGYQVTFSQSATGALGRILAGGDFQVVLCDVFMPGLSGIQFHGELLREAPGLARRLVFITGAPSDEVQAYVQDQQIPCMEKPFTGPEIRATVEALSRHH